MSENDDQSWKKKKNLCLLESNWTIFPEDLKAEMQNFCFW